MFRLNETIEAAAAKEAVSLRAWALAHGLPVSAVHDWARQGVVPSNLAIPALAIALGVEVQFLLDHVKSMRESGRTRSGIPIDTPEQTRAVLADRGHPVPQGA